MLVPVDLNKKKKSHSLPKPSNRQFNENEEENLSAPPVYLPTSLNLI